jgi:hypothetical protein
MLEFQNTINIDRLVHAVFAFVSACENIRKWNSERIAAGKVGSAAPENPGSPRLSLKTESLRCRWEEGNSVVCSAFLGEAARIDSSYYIYRQR